MGMHRIEWPCGDTSETDGYEPEKCPFCELAKLRAAAPLLLDALRAIVAADDAQELTQEHIDAARAAIAAATN